MNTKPDFAPLLRQIADRHGLAAGDVARLINDVAPGSASRRAVDYWLADRARRDSRPCESKWVSLLAQALWLQGRIKRADVEALRNLMHEVVLGSKQLAVPSGASVRMTAAALNMLNSTQHMRELKHIRARGGRSKAIEAVRRAKVSAPGL